MISQVHYAFAADALLVLHVFFVLFIVLGLVFIFAGKLLGWQWVRNRWFRRIHIIGIGVVVLQSWLGRVCPLTTWEMALRIKAEQPVYEGSFVAQWLNQLLYYNAPAWVFVAWYTGFGALVVFSWFWVRPHSRGRS